MSIFGGRCAIVASGVVASIASGASAQCFGQPAPLAPGGGQAANAWFGYSTAMRGDIAVVGRPFDLPNQAAHAYLWDGANFQFAAALTDPGSIAGFTGTAVDTDGVRVIAGSGLAANGASAVIYRREGASFVFEARLTPPGAGAQGRYGLAVAIEGDLAALGRDSFEGGADIYHRNNGVWTLVQSLQSNTPMEQTEFGEALDLSADHLVVGSPSDTFVPDVGPVGALYVFTRTPTGVAFQQRITSNAMPIGLGRAVAIEGATIVAGSGDSLNTIEDAFTFTLAGGQWSQQAVLPARDQAEFDNFGNAVAISGDFIAVGASQDDPFGADSGAVYLYRRTGDQWTPFLDLFAPGGASGDQFGHGVALDAGRLLIGAPTQNQGMIDNPGSAFAFSSASVAGTLLPADQSAEFGDAAAITADASGVPPFTYQWNIAGTPVPVGLPPYAGADTDTLTIDAVTATLTNSITVEVADACGFVTTLGPASINVTPPTNACPGDANADGQVLFNDITSVLTNFGLACPARRTPTVREGPLHRAPRATAPIYSPE